MTILTNYGLGRITDAIASSSPLTITNFIASDYFGELNLNWEVKSDLPGTHYVKKPVSYINKPDINTVEFVNIVQRSEATSQMGTVAILDEFDKIVLLSQPPSPIPPGMRQVLHTIVHYNNISDAISITGSTIDLTEIYSILMETSTLIGNSLYEIFNLKLSQQVISKILKEVKDRTEFVISHDKKAIYLYDSSTGMPYRIKIVGGDLIVEPVMGYGGDSIGDVV